MVNRTQGGENPRKILRNIVLWASLGDEGGRDFVGLHTYDFPISSETDKHYIVDGTSKRIKLSDLNRVMPGAVENSTNMIQFCFWTLSLEDTAAIVEQLKSAALAKIELEISLALRMKGLLLSEPEVVTKGTSTSRG